MEIFQSIMGLASSQQVITSRQGIYGFAESDKRPHRWLANPQDKSKEHTDTKLL